MSNLTTLEKLKLEKLFEMGGGYVLDFSNRTFHEFIMDNLNIDINDAKYDYESGSKANRLRAFWSKESNHLIGKLITELLGYWEAQKHLNYRDINREEQNLFDECRRIAQRLTSDIPVENIEAIQSYSDDKDILLLVKSIRESINKNEPEVALDRLHTYTMGYFRKLCNKYHLGYDRDTPLNGLFGRYEKFLEQNKIIESEMTIRILKSSISILEYFNKVRNLHTFAHNNPILNHNESVLIYNYVSSLIRFVESIELADAVSIEEDSFPPGWDDIPF